MTSENETASAAKRCGLCGAAFSDAWHWTRDDTPICAACAPQRVRSEVDPASAEISAEQKVREAQFWAEWGSGIEGDDVVRADTAIRIAEEHAAAATAALRSELDAERHARALYQDEHVTLLDERETLRRESDEAVQQIAKNRDEQMHAQHERHKFEREAYMLSAQATLNDYARRAANAEQERDAARAEAGKLRALLREWRESLRARVDAIGASQAMRNLTLKAEAEAKIAEIDAALGREQKT